MKTYKEEDLKNAYRQGARDYCSSYKGIDTFLNEDVDLYIESLSPKIEEETISFSYSFLRRKLDWEQFCNLTGVDYYARANGFEIKDTENFDIKESKAKEFNLI